MIDKYNFGKHTAALNSEYALWTFFEEEPYEQLSEDDITKICNQFPEIQFDIVSSQLESQIYIDYNMFNVIFRYLGDYIYALYMFVETGPNHYYRPCFIILFDQIEDLIDHGFHKDITDQIIDTTIVEPYLASLNLNE